MHVNMAFAWRWLPGRRFRDSRPVALELGLDIPLISHNGALTKHAETLQTVSVLPLPLAAAREALRIGRDAGADALLSDDHEGLGVLVYDHLARGQHGGTPLPRVGPQNSW